MFIKREHLTFNKRLPNYCSSNPGVSGSKLLGGSKVNSSFHPSEAWCPLLCQPPLNISTPHSKVSPLDKKHNVSPPPSPPIFCNGSPYPWFMELQLVWTKHSTKYGLLGICEIFNITKSTYLDCHMWFQ